MLSIGPLLLLQFLFLLEAHSIPLLSSLFSFRTRADSVCNGNALLCSRKYSAITFVGAHDSAFIGIWPTQNQEISVTDQLNGGIRFLQSQTHNFSSTLRMCHTSCLLEDGGLVEDYLREVKTWMDKNPNDVVSILLTNPDRVSMSQFDAVFRKVELDKLAFKPSSSPNPLAMKEWPSLGDMIAAGQRLVTFMDYGTDEVSVPYILDEFNYYFETPYDTTDEDFKQCKMDRSNKVDNGGQSSMYIMNHFLDINLNIFDENEPLLIPDRLSAGRTNAAGPGAGSIGDQAELCKTSFARYPNVVLLDYVNEGNATAAQNRMNGL